MNNETAPTLQLPEVPETFNNGVGVEFAKQLLALLSSTRVIGLSTDLAASIDFGQIQQKLNDMQAQLDLNSRKFRHVVMSGVTNAEMTVPFEDMGTTQYAAWATPIIDEGEDPGTIFACLVDGSKENTQVKFRIDGSGSAFKFEFFILEYNT